jgi:flagellar biosynthesis protein FlhB
MPEELYKQIPWGIQREFIQIFCISNPICRVVEKSHSSLVANTKLLLSLAVWFHSCVGLQFSAILIVDWIYNLPDVTSNATCKILAEGRIPPGETQWQRV